MDNNFTNDDIEILIRYMDGELDASGKKSVDILLQTNAAAKERYEQLLAAKQVIRSAGLQQHIKALHRQYYPEIQNAGTQQAKIIKPVFSMQAFMRVAAVFIMVLAGYGVYRYASVNNETLYQNNFINYQLPVTRGSGQNDSVAVLYAAKKYEMIIDALHNKQQKNVQDYFLSGLAYLQLNNAAAAVESLQQVQIINGAAPEKLYVQQTDYYLALAYIKTGKIVQARQKLATIMADKQHMFYSNAEKISAMDLTLLQWKNK